MAKQRDADNLPALAKIDMGISTLFKAVPIIGAALDYAVLGGVQEKRARRMERLLTEIAEGMKERGVSDEEAREAVQKEEFVQLLGDVAKDAAAATNEDKRERFRDLLLNAIALQEGANEWEEARLAVEWLRQLEGADGGYGCVL